jgi:hypothetical protein
VMRERQGCRSTSSQGDTGDVGERRFCRLRARRVDGRASTGVVLLALGLASFQVTADDCLFAGRLGGFPS